MSQLSFSDAEYYGKRKQTRREKFLAEMERAVPWKVFAEWVEPHDPKSGHGRRPYPLARMLRIHFMPQGFALSDPAMQEAMQAIQAPSDGRLFRPSLTVVGKSGPLCAR